MFGASDMLTAEGRGTKKGTSSLEALRSALKSQYHASLAMLRTAIRACPEDLWSSSDGHANRYWRIAYHTLYYTHLYLQSVPRRRTWAMDGEFGYNPGTTSGRGCVRAHPTAGAVSSTTRLDRYIDNSTLPR